VDLPNAFFFIDLVPESQDHCAFTLVLSQRYMHSSTLCHNLVAKGLAAWTHLVYTWLIMLMTFIKLSFSCRTRSSSSISAIGPIAMELAS
jgi:hypothetical protein